MNIFPIKRRRNMCRSAINILFSLLVFILHSKSHPLEVHVPVTLFQQDSGSHLETSLSWSYGQDIFGVYAKFCNSYFILDEIPRRQLWLTFTEKIHHDITSALNEGTLENIGAIELGGNPLLQGWIFSTVQDMVGVRQRFGDKAQSLDMLSVLDVILELGYIDFTTKVIVLPKYSYWLYERLPLFLNFIYRQIERFPECNLISYFTLYDGWREHTEPLQNPHFSPVTVDQLLERNYIGTGSAGEPGRFIRAKNVQTAVLSRAPLDSSDFDNNHIFPLLNLSVLSYSRHKGDKSVVLLPDHEFMSTHGYKQLRQDVDLCEVSWAQKLDSAIWRGRDHGVGYWRYNGGVEGGAGSKNCRDGNNDKLDKERVESSGTEAVGSMDGRATEGFVCMEHGDEDVSTAHLFSQRQLLVQRAASLSTVSVDIQFAGAAGAAGSEGAEAVPVYSSRCEQLQYKQLIDVDGEVNAWSGLFWKLYSKSLVLKVDSHFEQWYYDRLVPWRHYIPIKGDLSDLEDKLAWAQDPRNDAVCEQIALQGRELVMTLTYESELRAPLSVADIW